MNNRIGVGIVGIQPGRSWSASAHVPALRALDGFDIVAVATTRAESAEQAAATFGIPKGYAGHRALIADPKVDLVAVTVRVPHHREIVLDAVAAGKAVYCEWPLGNGLAEAREMRDAAAEAGVHGFVGLQARFAPPILHAKELIAQGAIGEVLSTTMVGSGINWGPTVASFGQFGADITNGATLLTIPFGHAIDALCFLLGEFSSGSAMTSVRRPVITIIETGEVIPKTAPDQVIFSGQLASGATASIHYRAGTSTGTNFLWEINGTEGDIVLTAAGGHAQIYPLALKAALWGAGNLESLSQPSHLRTAPAEVKGAALNVAQAYAAVLADLRDGTHTAPSFDDAVMRHLLLDRVELSARERRWVDL